MAAASPSLITYEQVENVHATTGLCVCIPTHPFESQRMHRRGYHIFIQCQLHLYRCHMLICLCVEVAHISCTAAHPHQQLCSHRLIQPCSVRGLFLFPSLPCMIVRDQSFFCVLNEVMLRKLGMLNHVALPSRFPQCIKSDDLTD